MHGSHEIVPLIPEGYRRRSAMEYGLSAGFISLVLRLAYSSPGQQSA